MNKLIFITLSTLILILIISTKFIQAKNLNKKSQWITLTVKFHDKTIITHRIPYKKGMTVADAHKFASKTKHGLRKFQCLANKKTIDCKKVAPKSKFLISVNDIDSRSVGGWWWLTINKKSADKGFGTCKIKKPGANINWHIIGKSNRHKIDKGTCG